MLPFSFFQTLNEMQIHFSGGAKYGQVVFLGGGAGCLAKNTEVLMYNGEIKFVQDIVENDLVMGPDSLPRKVTKIIRGRETMLKVSSARNAGYISNMSHIHSFKCNHTKCGLVAGQIYNMTYEEYSQLKPSAKKSLVLYTVPVEFAKRETACNPYIVGLWLGDGCYINTSILIDETNNDVVDYVRDSVSSEGYNFNKLKCDKEKVSLFSITFSGASRSTPNVYRTHLTKECFVEGEKRIPREYLINDTKTRKLVLAGLIDSDGYNGDGYYEILTKYKGLCDDITLLAKSLGYHVSTTEKKMLWKGQDKLYYRIFISGNNLSELPVLVKYKKITERKQIKNTSHYHPKFEILDEDEYFGFSLDSDDKRFVLGNFVVTHNSGKGFAIEKFIEGENFKVFDVDNFKKQLIKLGERGVPGYEAFAKYDLKNPNDVFALHAEVKRRGIFDHAIETFARANGGGKYLPNILFDMTLKNGDDLAWLIPMLRKAGYDKKNIHLLWVLTNFSQAVSQNASRERRVPDDILLGTHEGAAVNITRMMQGKIPPDLDGKVAVVLNNKETQNMLQGQKIINKEGDHIKYPTRRGGFKYLILKKEGQPMMLDNHKKRRMMMQWVRDNIPRTDKTAVLWPKGQAHT